MGDTGLHGCTEQEGGEKWTEGMCCPIPPTCSLSFSSSCVCRCDTAHGSSKAHSPTGPLWRGQQSPNIVLQTRSTAGPG